METKSLSTVLRLILMLSAFDKSDFIRKSVLVLFFSAFSTGIFAHILTVNNQDGSAQYTTIQSACNAANSGDSIYVNGSSTPYQTFIINNKKLAVFGPGWSPFTGLTAIVPKCYLSGTGSSGSELHGLTFTSAIEIQSSGVNGLVFIRNKFSGVQFDSTVSGYLFEGNWFFNGSIILIIGTPLFNLSNFMFMDNLFFGSYCVNFQGTALTFNHNLWYGGGGPFSNCKSLTLSNNIFDGQIVTGVSLSGFNNNITYQCNVDAPWNINGNTDAGNNVAGQSPQMADQTSVTSNISNPLLDFTISAGPANNTGSDGKDMGLLYDNGGLANWNRSRAANLPYISSVTISNQSIFKNSKIYFTAEAKSN